MAALILFFHQHMNLISFSNFLIDFHLGADEADRYLVDQFVS